MAEGMIFEKKTKIGYELACFMTYILQKGNEHALQAVSKR